MVNPCLVSLLILVVVASGKWSPLSVALFSSRVHPRVGKAVMQTAANARASLLVIEGFIFPISVRHRTSTSPGRRQVIVHFLAADRRLRVHAFVIPHFQSGLARFKWHLVRWAEVIAELVVMLSIAVLNFHRAPDSFEFISARIWDDLDRESLILTFHDPQVMDDEASFLPV